jgi:peptidoglycan/xylan/chitin deacetylase (PgdA/CDA1 family)
MSIHTIPLKRWIAKKGSRVAVGLGTYPFASQAKKNALRILTYHRFVDEPRSPFSVAGHALDKQMQWLAAENAQRGSDAILSTLAGERQSGCVVTMDDGDPSVYEVAAPIFERHKIPYIIYAVPSRIGQNDHMTPAQMRDLVGRGAEIGSHSMTHRSMTSLSAKELTFELTESKKRIEDITGKAATSFAYPFGTLRDFNATVADAMREAGYAFALTSQHGVVEAGQDAMLLPRIKIEGGDPDWLFHMACRGGLDAWRFIDAGLSGMQKPEAKDLTLRKGLAADAK